MGRLIACGVDFFKLYGTEELAIRDSPRAVDAAVTEIAAVHEALGTQVNFGVDFYAAWPRRWPSGF